MPHLGLYPFAYDGSAIDLLDGQIVASNGAAHDAMRAVIARVHAADAHR